MQRVQVRCTSTEPTPLRNMQSKGLYKKDYLTDGIFTLWGGEWWSSELETWVMDAFVCKLKSARIRTPTPLVTFLIYSSACHQMHILAHLNPHQPTPTVLTHTYWNIPGCHYINHFPCGGRFLMGSTHYLTRHNTFYCLFQRRWSGTRCDPYPSSYIKPVAWDIIIILVVFRAFVKPGIPPFINISIPGGKTTTTTHGVVASTAWRFNRMLFVPLPLYLSVSQIDSGSELRIAHIYHTVEQSSIGESIPWPPVEH